MIQILFSCWQVVGEYGMAHFSDKGKSKGKDYCIFFNSQWARLPQDLNKAVSHEWPTKHVTNNNAISWICFTVTQNSGNKLECAHLCWWSIKCFSGSFSQDAEIWSPLLVLVRTLAASFWTNCKCWICSWLISEVITELQEFTLEEINGQLQFLGHKQIN